MVKSNARLVASNHESSVILRASMEAKQGQSYVEELVEELALDERNADVAGGSPRIVDVAAKNSTVSQDLRYESVVAINLCEYEVVLVDDGEVKSNARLVASNHWSNVIPRAGMEAKHIAGRASLIEALRMLGDEEPGQPHRQRLLAQLVLDEEAHMSALADAADVSCVALRIGAKKKKAREKLSG